MRASYPVVTGMPLKMGRGGGKPQEISVLQKKMIVKIRSLYLLSCFTMQNTDKKAK